jgi:hypothetical protein
MLAKYGICMPIVIIQPVMTKVQVQVLNAKEVIIESILCPRVGSADQIITRPPIKAVT